LSDVLTLLPLPLPSPAGLIVPPFVVMKFAVGADVKVQQYAIAASLM
jgi:hypothetical protein